MLTSNTRICSPHIIKYFATEYSFQKILKFTHKIIWHNSIHSGILTIHPFNNDINDTAV